MTTAKRASITTTTHHMTTEKFRCINVNAAKILLKNTGVNMNSAEKPLKIPNTCTTNQRQNQ